MGNVRRRAQRSVSIIIVTSWLIGLLLSGLGAVIADARTEHEHEGFYPQVERTFNLRKHNAASATNHVIQSSTDAFVDSESATTISGESKSEEEKSKEGSAEWISSRDEVDNFGQNSLRGPRRQLLTSDRDYRSDNSRIRKRLRTQHHYHSNKPKIRAVELSTQEVSSKDALTLLELKKGVVEDPNGVLSSWGLEKTGDVCESWYGVRCDPVSGEVSEINLANSKLVGTISPKLGDLSSLLELVLSNNSFTGVIPASLGDASSLHTIWLDGNNLTGGIPESLGHLTGLLTLDLHSNMIEGNIPKSLGSCSSLTTLSLGGNKLTGTIPDSLEGCLGLRVLSVENNQLMGSIPAFVTSLEELTLLQVSGNILSGSIPDFTSSGSHLVTLAASHNALTGEIPSSIGNCTSLQTLLLDGNKLSGSIPTEMESLQNLSRLSLRGNILSGMIPYFIGQLAALTELELDENQLHGLIPESLGELPLLQFLSLARNKFSGEIPSALWASRSLEFLYLESNTLSGFLSIPTDPGTSTLRELVLSDNHLSGQLPVEWSTLLDLEVLGLEANKFTGSVPPSLGNLKKLQVLDLSANLLSGTIPPELGLLTQLRSLHLSDNSLIGEIPEALSNCSELVDIQLSRNSLTGYIPQGFSSLRHLKTLSLKDNKFGATFPDFLDGMGHLTRIDLSGNHLTGPIPVSISNFTSLQSLNLANNKLKGPIPLELFSLVALEELILSSNNLDGEIPSEIGQLSRLSVLTLNNNNFTGPIPSSIGNCSNLVELNLAHNRFSGKLPGSAIANLTRLSVRLNLASNNFSGLLPEELGFLGLVQTMNLSFNSFVLRIPASIANCTALQSLDMSHNHLCGEIPAPLALMTNLVYFNVSYNNLEGPIPVTGIFRDNLTAESFTGNPRLCGYQIERNCSIESQNEKCNGFDCNWFAITSGVIGVLLVGIGVTIWYCLFTKVIEYHRKTLGPEMPHVQQLKVTVHDLTKATDAFSLANIIGVGTRSTVFKGTLPGGDLIAVKKLEKDESGTNLWEKKDLYREIDFLSKLRHTNLIRTLSVCWNLDTKALVFDFMKNGTLQQHLHDDLQPGEASKLTWDIRRDIALGIAQGLVFLHHDCADKRGGEPVIHGDLKPGNVFLDEDFRPQLADIGLARSIMPEEINMGNEQALEIALTIGTRDYMAPECVDPTTRFSTKGDVYSFGVILLELVTGKPPSGDAEIFGEEKALVDWVREAIMPEYVIDPNLGDEFQEMVTKNQILLTLQSAMLCTQDSPERRPDMKEVLDILNRMKDRTCPL